MLSKFYSSVYNFPILVINVRTDGMKVDIGVPVLFGYDCSISFGIQFPAKITLINYLELSSYCAVLGKSDPDMV